MLQYKPVMQDEIEIPSVLQPAGKDSRKMMPIESIVTELSGKRVAVVWFLAECPAFFTVETTILPEMQLLQTEPNPVLGQRRTLP
jgi:hypothetical protein